MLRNSHTAKFLWILLGCWLMITTTPTYAQDVNRFAYAYLGRLADGQSRLVLIDPTAPEKAAQQVRLELPADMNYIQEIYLSSDGKWVGSLGKERTILRLTNLLTNEFHDIDIGYLLAIAWSPDSESIAVVTSERFTYTPFVYSLKTQTLTKYPSAISSGLKIAWSPDSHYLVTTTTYCLGLDIDTCTASINLYDIPLVKKRVVDVSFLISESGLGGYLLCELNWSPNSQYLSFVSGCFLEIARGYKEVYVLQITSGEVQRITNFTVNMLEGTTAETVYALYKTWWQDNNTIYMGVVMWINDYKPTDSFTAQYTLQDNTLKITSEVGSAQWTANPVTGEVAYITSEAVNLSEEISEGSKAVIAATSEGKLTPQREFHGGCFPAWSPNGKLLTVLTYTTPSCRAGLKSIVFIDPTTGDSHQHDIAVDQGLRVDWAQPIGWVRTN